MFLGPIYHPVNQPVGQAPLKAVAGAESMLCQYPHSPYASCFSSSLRLPGRSAGFFFIT